MDDYVLLLGKHIQDQQPQVEAKHAISWVMPAAAANSPFDAHRDEAINSPEFVDLFIPRGRRRASSPPAGLRNAPLADSTRRSL